jgi:hypothetical protein
LLNTGSFDLSPETSNENNEAKNKRRQFTIEQMQIILTDPRPPYKIAQDFNVTPKVIIRICREAGIPNPGRALKSTQ